MSVNANRLPTLAHSRIEHYDDRGEPTVSILIGAGIPFEPWNAYKAEYQLSFTEQRSQARSIGCLLDFIASCSSEFEGVDRRARLFRAFAQRLSEGTIGRNGDDTGLMWHPRSAHSVKVIVSDVTRFTDWLVDEAETKPRNPFNPSRPATAAEQIAFWRSWHRSTRGAFFTHLGPSERAKRASLRARRTRASKEPKVHRDPPRFPESAAADLISRGFLSKGRPLWTILRDQLITLLLVGGGLRVSEPLQLYACDVFVHPEDDTMAVVRIYHPSQGTVRLHDPISGEPQQMNRKQFLRHVYDLSPLTESVGKRRVGWKDPLLNDDRENYMLVFWRSRRLCQAFLQVFRRYLQVAPMPRSHPYLFFASSGRPMSVPGFEKVHAAACRRIGLTPMKRLGTTPHGHRHAWGGWANDRKVKGKAVQVGLHHKSAESPQIYQGMTLSEILDEMSIRDRAGQTIGELGLADE